MSWYTRNGVKPVGPVTADSISEKLLTGEMSPFDWLWSDADREWREAQKWPKFAGLNVPARQDQGVPEREEVWVLIDENGKTTGPWSLAQIRSGVQDGRFKPDYSIWKKGMTGWARIADRPEGLISPARENLSQP